MDKAALLARAKADPVAFREETAKALDAAEWCDYAGDLRSGVTHSGRSVSHESTLRDVARHIKWMKSTDDADAVALAHVEALAEALGVKL